MGIHYKNIDKKIVPDPGIYFDEKNELKRFYDHKGGKILKSSKIL